MSRILSIILTKTEKIAGNFVDGQPPEEVEVIPIFGAGML